MLQSEFKIWGKNIPIFVHQHIIMYYQNLSAQQTIVQYLSGT